MSDQAGCHRGRRRIVGRRPRRTAERGSGLPRPAARGRPGLPLRGRAPAAVRGQRRAQLAASRACPSSTGISPIATAPDDGADARSGCRAAGWSAARRWSTPPSPPGRRRSISTAGRPRLPGLGLGSLLPVLRRIETDLDFGHEPIHGADGPIVIQRYREPSWAPVNRVFAEACEALGVRHAPDLNAADAACRRLRAACRTTATRRCGSARW